MLALLEYRDIEFDTLSFCKRETEQVANFKTVVIGDNGIGKSRLLSRIVNIFRLINTKDTQNIKLYPFFLSFRFKNEIYNVSLSDGKYGFFKNDKEVSIDELPKLNILAISTTFGDRFYFPTETEDGDKDEFYNYCGIRETSNAAFANSGSRKTIENIFNLVNKGKSKHLVSTLNLLNLSPSITIKITPRRKRKFKEILKDPTLLYDYFNNYRESSRLQVNEFNSYDLEHSESVVNILNKLNYVDEVGYLSINLEENNYISGDMYYLLNSLRRVGIINNLELILYKKNNVGHLFTECSSGEAQLLLTITSLIVNINDNSIVMIDEPELSLHPNWQLRYISLIKKILLTYKNCHVLLATHSHFLVSDLTPNDSSLVCLQEGKDKIIHLDIPYSTYGWSPESILYNIFNVRSVNSVYLERDLNKALEIISTNQSDKTELKRLNNKFKSLVFDDEDPIYSIINKIERHLNSND